MKKKLLVSLLAAGLVLPSTAALAKDNAGVWGNLVDQLKSKSNEAKIKELEAKIGDLTHELEVEAPKVFKLGQSIKDSEAKIKKLEEVKVAAKVAKMDDKVAEYEAKINEEKAKLEAAKANKNAQVAKVAELEKQLKAAKDKLAKLNPEAKKDEAKKDEAKKDEAKKDEAKKENGKKVLPKTSAVK